MDENGKKCTIEKVKKSVKSCIECLILGVIGVYAKDAKWGSNSSSSAMVKL